MQLLIGTAEEGNVAVGSVKWMAPIAQAAPAFLGPLQEGRRLLFIANNVPAAIGKFHEALQVATGLEREEWKAYPLGMLTHCNERGGNLQGAIQCAHRALAAVGRSGDRELLFRLLADKARLSQAIRDQSGELDTLEQLVALAKEGVGGRDAYLALLHHLSQRQCHGRLFDKALPNLHELKRAAEVVKNVLMVEVALELLGGVHRECGRFGDASASLLEACRLAALRRDPAKECRLRAALLQVYVAQPQGSVSEYWATRAQIDAFGPIALSVRAEVQDCDGRMRRKEAAAIASLMLSMAAP